MENERTKTNLFYFCKAGLEITIIDCRRLVYEKIIEAEERARGYCVVLQKEKKKDKRK